MSTRRNAAPGGSGPTLLVQPSFRVLQVGRERTIESSEEPSTPSLGPKPGNNSLASWWTLAVSLLRDRLSPAPDSPPPRGDRVPRNGGAARDSRGLRDLPSDLTARGGRKDRIVRGCQSTGPPQKAGPARTVRIRLSRCNDTTPYVAHPGRPCEGASLTLRSWASSCCHSGMR